MSSPEALAIAPAPLKIVPQAPVGSKDTLEAMISLPSFQEAIRKILPSHLKAERVLKMALVAASRQPLLYKCTQGSIIQSVMRSAELGLDCSGTLGQGYLVPFYNKGVNGYEAQFIPGYRGIVNLAHRANKDLTFEARVVYTNDFFDFEYGLESKLVHKPTLDAPGDIRFFYCVTHEPGKRSQFTVMTKSEIDGIQARSKSRDRTGRLVGPWVTDYAEMGRKTVIKRHAKLLELAVEVADLVAEDDEQYRSSYALASEVTNNTVGIAAMKSRMVGLPSREEEPEEIPFSEPDALPVIGDEAVGPDEVDVAIASDPDPDEVAEREAIESETTPPEDEAALKLYDQRRVCMELYQALEQENPTKFASATKWLGSRAIPELVGPQLDAFLKILNK